MVGEVVQLLEELYRRGGYVIFRGDSVKFRAPLGAVPDDLADALAERRAEVCALVVEEELRALGLLRCQECRRIQPGHYLRDGVCDECEVMPAADDLCHVEREAQR